MTSWLPNRACAPPVPGQGFPLCRIAPSPYIAENRRSNRLYVPGVRSSRTRLPSGRRNDPKTKPSGLIPKDASNEYIAQDCTDQFMIGEQLNLSRSARLVWPMMLSAEQLILPYRTESAEDRLVVTCESKRYYRAEAVV